MGPYKKMDPQELRQQMTYMFILSLFFDFALRNILLMWKPPRSLSNMFKLLPSTPLLDCVLQTSKYNNYSISNYILPIFLQVHSPRGTASHPMPSFLARTTHKFAACPRWNRYPLVMPTYSNETHKFEVNPLALNNSLGILFVFCFA